MLLNLGLKIQRLILRGLTLPLDQWFSGGYQAPTDAQPPLEREQN